MLIRMGIPGAGTRFRPHRERHGTGPAARLPRRRDPRRGRGRGARLHCRRGPGRRPSLAAEHHPGAHRAQPGGGAPRLRVQSTVRIDEPVVTVQLDVSCGTRLTRRFVVLIDPPTYQVPRCPRSPRRRAPHPRRRPSRDRPQRARRAAPRRRPALPSGGAIPHGARPALQPRVRRAPRRAWHAVACRAPDCRRRCRQCRAGLALGTDGGRRPPRGQPRECAGRFAAGARCRRTGSPDDLGHALRCRGVRRVRGGCFRRRGGPRA